MHNTNTHLKLSLDQQDSDSECCWGVGREDGGLVEVNV